MRSSDLTLVVVGGRLARSVRSSDLIHSRRRHRRRRRQRRLSDCDH